MNIGPMDKNKPYVEINTGTLVSLLNEQNSHIKHLREMAQELVNDHPCKTGADDCHCSTCTMTHALSVTSGYR